MEYLFQIDSLEVRSQLLLDRWSIDHGKEMSVYDHSLQRGQFLDQPIDHRFEMLFHKPFNGHIFISEKIIPCMKWESHRGTVPSFVGYGTLDHPNGFFNCDPDLDINRLVSRKCTTSENSRGTGSDNQNFFAHFLNFENSIISLLRISILGVQSKIFSAQMYFFSVYQIWQVVYNFFEKQKKKLFSIYLLYEVL